jgi:aminoglycoside phosphotransferase (APT) family kinase protein
VEEEPDIVEREANTLDILERAAVPTPGLLSADFTGEDAGVPALLMTRLPGRLDWSPSDMGRWLHDLAAVLPEIHATPVTDDDGVQAFRPYRPRSWEAPEWLQDPSLWNRARAVFHGPVLDPDRVFIHRDYHPGNVLWRRGRVSGVVDWPVASRGPRTVDVVHCRGNLIDRFGLEVADRWVEIWKSVSGSAYHPWAEVVMLVDGMTWREQRDRRSALDLEEALARSLADLGA